MEVEVKRIHFKGRGKTTRPTCQTCGEDLKRSYVYEWKNGKGKYVANGWECPCHKNKKWD